MYTCGWCKTHYEKWTPNCAYCGGAMQPKSGKELGLEPGPAPRQLPKNFDQRFFGLQSFNIFAGIAFFIIGGGILLMLIGLKNWIAYAIAVFPAFFVVGGFFMAKNAIVHITQVLHILRHGEPAVGRITEVKVDLMERMNKRAPRRVSYEFEDKVSGQIYTGFFQTWDKASANRKKGDQTRVLYLKEDPAKNTVFPPVV